MQKILTSLCLCFCVSISINVLADTKCFLVKENNHILKQEGECRTRYSPCSTFKIAISLMGYNEGILTNVNKPNFSFKKGYVDWLDVWKQTHNPTSWMKNSCVWYSQLLTNKLELKKFEDYINKFNYGNKDATGDKGQNNGLQSSWLSSSLEISPEEQAEFLQALVNNKLPVNLNASELTKEILFVEELQDGWKLYGKTGNGSQLNKDRTKKLDLQQGWFVGWIQNGQRKIVFVNHIADSTKQDSYASLRAKAEAKEKLLTLIKTLK